MSNRIDELHQEVMGMEGFPRDKWSFICDLFDLTTYDDEVTEAWGKIIVEVMKSIHERTTFKYIEKSDAHYIQYLLVANLLKKHKLIDWGCSTRGAWYDLGKTKLLQSEDEVKYLLYEFLEDNS